MQELYLWATPLDPTIFLFIVEQMTVDVSLYICL